MLRQVSIPTPWDLRDFLENLGEQRSRPIVLAEAPALADQSVSAQWWKQSDADVILYAPTQSTFYLELNVFHEVGHMLCGHDKRYTPFSEQDMEALTSAPGAASIIFSRSSRFDSDEEREAEFTAYRLKLMIERGTTVADDDPTNAHMRKAMRRALGNADA